MDLASTIAPKSDQLNADDLIAGPRTITITRVTGNEGSAEQPVNIHFDGDGGKPFRPCKSMRRVLVAAWGNDASQFAGRSLTLYRDPRVQFGGLAVGGIRISHMSHIERDLTMALTESRAKRAPFTVKKLAGAQAQKPAPDGQDALVELRRRARLAAEQGTVTFRGFWNEPETKRHWEALKPMLDEYKRVAQAADAKGAPDEPDPFSGGADPTEEDFARAEAAAREEAGRLAAEG